MDKASAVETAVAAGRMWVVPRSYPKELHGGVVRVARNRGRVTLQQIAGDFGITYSGLQRWLQGAGVEDGVRPGAPETELSENSQLRRRIWLLEPETEVLRRAAAYLSQANLPGNDLPARPRVGRGQRPRHSDVPGALAPPPAFLQLGHVPVTNSELNGAYHRAPDGWGELYLCAIKD